MYCFLGAFTKLQKVTISFVMSVRPSAWNNSAYSAGYSDYEKWTSLLRLYVHCQSFWFLFWKTENRLYLTLLYLYARFLMTDLFVLVSSPQQQRSRTTTTGRDSRTQRKAGREGEMPRGDSKGHGHFTVCLMVLQLLFYSVTCFLLFDHCMTWSCAYVVTRDRHINGGW